MLPPKNFRSITLTFGNHILEVASMGRPGSGPNSDKEDLEYLKEKKIKIIISMEPDIRHKRLAESLGMTYLDKYVQDYSAPSIGLFEEIYKIALSNANHSVAIHCGYGVGRTATVLCAMKLKDLFLKKMDSTIERNASISVTRKENDTQLCPCTLLVKEAVEAIRMADLPNFQSVEVPDQIQRLCEYQEYLRDTIAEDPTFFNRVY